MYLHPILLGELCRIASDELGMAVSIISNGSKITPEWMNAYAQFVDVLGVSVDSFDQDTNAAIGRAGIPTIITLNACCMFEIFALNTMCASRLIQ